MKRPGRGGDGEAADGAPPPLLLDATQHVKELVQRCMKKVFGGNLGLVLVGQTRCRKKQDDGDGVRGRKWQIHRTRRAQMLRLVYAKYRRERFPAAVWQRIEAEANAPAAESAVGRFIAEHLVAVAARRAKKRKRREAFRAEARQCVEQRTSGGGGGVVVVTVSETDDDDGECIVQIHNTGGGGGTPMDISGDGDTESRRR